MTCTVYGLRLIGSDEIRYVGQTKKNIDYRLSTHYCQAKIGSQLPVHRWLRKHRGEVEIFALASNAVWNDSEVVAIEKIKSQGHRLLNCTLGGDGVSGVTLSDETKIKMSKAHGHLTEDLVREIRLRRSRGEVNGQIAKDLGFLRGCVAAAAAGRTWRWVA